MRIYLPLALLLACQSTPDVRPRQAPEPNVPDEVVLPEAPVSESTLPDSDIDVVSWLFDDTVIHQVALTVDEVHLLELLDEPYLKVPADVVIDGHVVDQIGVRLRGKLGSFQDVNEKPKWKLDFNFEHPGRRFFGLKSLALNNSVADCSFLREKLAYSIYSELGLKVPRVTWAQVTVNEQDYGLYQLIETPDGPWLDRVMSNPTGNLYDAKYLWGGGWDIEMLDFDDRASKMSLEEGVDVANADVIAVSWAANDGTAAGEWMAYTDSLVDWDNVHRMMVAELFTDHWDGYAIGQNNYRVWVDPDTGKIQMIPWDLDNTFNSSWWTSHDWREPEGVLAVGCTEDPTCIADYFARLSESLTVLEGIDWEARVTPWADLTIDAAKADPRVGCSDARVGNDRADLAEWMVVRPNELRLEWGL